MYYKMKDIKNYEWIYKISNKGIIINTKTNKIKKSRIHKTWYEYIDLHKKWIKKTFKVHRLVAEAFIPNTKHKRCVNHKDWDKTNNNLENLEWVSYKENTYHLMNILWYKLDWNKWKIYHSKKVKQYDKLWKFIKDWDYIKQASIDLGIDNSDITKACKWKLKTAWWYKWKYL